MSLNRALVDRARRVYSREDPTQPWQDGAPPGEQAFGPWVRVRMRVQNEGESQEVRLDETGALLIGLRDETGAPTFVGARFTAWDADDMVEVEYEGSVERWYVASGVRPMRRRKGYVGFRCDVRQSREAVVSEGALLAPEPLPQVTGVPDRFTAAPVRAPEPEPAPEPAEEPVVDAPLSEPEWGTEVG